ncbi:unnamed protein product, partial [Discosporangium mesarthrocarpum]
MQEKSRDEQDLDDFLAGIDDNWGAPFSSAGKAFDSMFTNAAGGGEWDASEGGTKQRSAKEEVQGEGSGNGGGEEMMVWLASLDGRSPQDGNRTRGNRQTPMEANFAPTSFTPGNEEVPGVEPEIIEDEIGDADAAEVTMEGKPTTRMETEWAVGSGSVGVTPESLAVHDRQTKAESSHLKNGEGEPPRNVAGAEEGLDWPNALESLGLGKEDTKHATTEEFPDFVEVRDPRFVSQWPKPSLNREGRVESSVTATAGGGGGGGGRGLPSAAGLQQL